MGLEKHPSDGNLASFVVEPRLQWPCLSPDHCSTAQCGWVMDFTLLQVDLVRTRVKLLKFLSQMLKSRWKFGSGRLWVCGELWLQRVEELGEVVGRGSLGGVCGGKGERAKGSVHGQL